MKLLTKTWCLAALGFLMPAPNLNAQPYVQTIKGLVLDKAVQEPLPGATVRVGEGADAFKTITDAEGRFRIDGIALGQYSVRVQCLGYKEWATTGVVLNSGKETDLTIGMEESVIAAKEVVVSAQSERLKPLNPFAVNSARSFAVEETQRYAAAANDPARMASAFAGVAVPGDDNNTIVIRGNAPAGLLWRLEGVDIPNPNHFANAGSTGGAISVLSAQVLGSSDFFTGAFPAEYGNALSGVFDLNLRKGNTEKREYTLQAGLLGFEAAAEGPMRVKSQKGSFLFNYRYSSLYLLSKLGIDIGDVKTKFQDISFKIWLPAGRVGEFSLFGLGGVSGENLPGQADSTIWQRHPDKRFNSVFTADMGVLGLIHQKRWGNVLWKQVLSWSGSKNVDKFERYKDDYALQAISLQNHLQQRCTYSTSLSQKLNARHLWKIGAYATRHGFDLTQTAFQPMENRSNPLIVNAGHFFFLNGFAQWQYHPSNKLLFNAGVHTCFLTLHHQQSIEPRASMAFTLSPHQTLGLSYGLHSQMQPIGVYFTEDSSGRILNPALGLSKAQHFVASYRIGLGRFWQLKTEIYDQNLYQVPVSRDSANTFSMLNEADGFTGNALENTGGGHNYGIEFSLEHPLANGFYCLLSVSIYQSKYRASDGIWRNTRYNGNYLSNLVAGKSWDWNRNNKQRTVELNFKITHFGGLREAPIDLVKSGALGYTVRDEQRAFEAQLPAYFRLDFGVHLKRHFAHATTTLYLDIQNASDRQNARSSTYEPFFQAVGYTYQEGLIPIFGYKVEF